MVNTKWKWVSVLSMLLALFASNSAYAADDFYWSDVEPIPSCYKSRDGKPNEMGLVVDGKKVTLGDPSCEEAKKNRVLVLVEGKYLHARLTADGYAEPFIENGRTMIPLRALADVFGFETDWDASEGRITLTKDGRNIVMHIGKSEILVDGQTVHFEGAVPMVKNNRTFLPASKLAEILGIQVDWDGNTRTATFSFSSIES